MLSHMALLIVIHDMLTSSLIPTRDIADIIGKPYPTLMREANPNDHGAKMSIETLIDLMLVTGDFKPIEEIARILGGRFVRVA